MTEPLHDLPLEREALGTVHLAPELLPTLELVDGARLYDPHKEDR